MAAALPDLLKAVSSEHDLILTMHKENAYLSSVLSVSSVVNITFASLACKTGLYQFTDDMPNQNMSLHTGIASRTMKFHLPSKLGGCPRIERPTAEAPFRP